MENFENRPVEPAQEPVFVPPVEQPVYQPAEQPTFVPEQPNFAIEQPAYTEPPKQKKVRSDPKGWTVALCIVLILGLVFSTAWTMGTYYNGKLEAMQSEYSSRINGLEERIEALQNAPATATRPSGTTQAPSVQQPTGDLLTPAQVYEQNLPSVVMIKTVLRGNYFSAGGTNTGSGFVISSDGYVVTNYHVVEGGSTLSVVLYNGTEHAATLVGFDNANDVALLKVEAEGLQAVVLGDSDALVVGDQVAAIGNPLGELTSTMTVGYVSAKERDVNTSGFAINMIQTDAAINSGNSGGPLFNMKGEVVGITTAKYSGTSGNGATIEGIGFAIPIDDVTGLLADIGSYGYVTGAYLGVSVSDMNATAADYYGLPMGAYVQKVEAGLAAERAGIQPKDIITSVGGIPVGSVNDLTRALRNFKAGDLTVVTVYRGGREMNFHVTLDAKPVANQE